ncbi:MAG: glycosyltransferase family 4 protein [Solirubrobacteraceae bacterium]
MILFLHNRYRTTGGEEQVVDDLAWLVRERLDEPVELMQRDSQRLRRSRAVAALLAGGSAPAEVARAVASTRARVLHAHNLNPLFGWRALAAARHAGAKVVLHIHQYRLVCAVGVCFTEGRECTRCHGRNTLPGVLHNCRGSRGESLSYAAALALWQRRVLEHADAVIVPSAFAAARLRELGAPLPERVDVLPPPLRSLGESVAPAHRGSVVRSGRRGYALVVSRLAPEKGVDVAIDACALAARPLVIAGDGPLAAKLRARAQRGGGSVRFAGRVGAEELSRLRAGAAVALVPSRSAETFGIAAAEAMAARVPVLASAVGALPELVPAEGLVQPGRPDALAEGIERLWGSGDAAERARSRVERVCAPEVLAATLAEVYDRATARAGTVPRAAGRAGGADGRAGAA